MISNTATEKAVGELKAEQAAHRLSEEKMVLIFRGVLRWGIFCEDILAALGHLWEYPTCSKAVGWHGIQCRVYFSWPIEPSLQNGSASHNEFSFLYYGFGYPAMVHPFCSPEGLGGDRWLPASCLSFPGAIA